MKILFDLSGVHKWVFEGIMTLTCSLIFIENYVRFFFVCVFFISRIFLGFLISKTSKYLLLIFLLSTDPMDSDSKKPLEPTTAAFLKTVTSEEGKSNGIPNGVAGTVRLNGVKNGVKNGIKISNGDSGEHNVISNGCISNGVHNAKSSGIFNRACAEKTHMSSDTLKRAENGDSAGPQIHSVNGSIAVNGS